MDAGETLRALAEAEDLPKDALQAATARRAEMIPLFLAAIERFLTAPAKERAEPTALFYIFHLVGSWREKSAYRPLARFLLCAQVDDIRGDATTIASHRVMAAIRWSLFIRRASARASSIKPLPMNARAAPLGEKALA